MSFDFATVVSPFRMQPGLRRVAPGASQLTPCRPTSAHLVAKLAVLRADAEQALLAVPGFDPLVALQAVMRQAALDHPAAFHWDGDRQLQCRWLGWSVCDGSVTGDGPAVIGDCLHALPPEHRTAGLLCLALEEDLAVIDGANGLIPWLAVCLPSRWSPREKIGQHFAEVHGPVADNRLLLAAGDHLARLVTGTDRWERFVWTITSRPELDTHPDRCADGVWPDTDDAETLAAKAWFRTEHQTFIPMAPQARQAVFTIRVAVRPLVDAVDDADKAGRLHDALASMTAEVLAYRGLAPARERLLAWLQVCAG